MKVTENFKEIDINIDNVKLKGNLRVTDESHGIIVFSHGSGSSRLSIRNNYVANLLFEQGFSSLLFDLLTLEEDKVYENRFNIELLTKRLVKVTKWLHDLPEFKKGKIGLFGSSTGAASALGTASKLPKIVNAVVSRGGRPDLAMPYLPEVVAPTLLLVGSKDTVVIELNLKAQQEMQHICKLEIIEGATHLFPESGKLEEVAKLTGAWFKKYLIS